MKYLYLITYESSDWCGASGTKVVVWAESEDDAEYYAENHMIEEMQAMFSDEYSYDSDLAEDTGYYSITSIERFGPDHDEWKYYKDAYQELFYPVIGEP